MAHGAVQQCEGWLHNAVLCEHVNDVGWLVIVTPYLFRSGIIPGLTAVAMSFKANLSKGHPSALLRQRRTRNWDEMRRANGLSEGAATALAGWKLVTYHLLEPPIFLVLFHLYSSQMDAVIWWLTAVVSVRQWAYFATAWVVAARSPSFFLIRTHTLGWGLVTYACVPDMFFLFTIMKIGTVGRVISLLNWCGAAAFFIVAWSSRPSTPLTAVYAAETFGLLYLLFILYLPRLEAYASARELEVEELEEDLERPWLAVS